MIHRLLRSQDCGEIAAEDPSPIRDREPREEHAPELGTRVEKDDIGPEQDA